MKKHLLKLIGAVMMIAAIVLTQIPSSNAKAVGSNDGGYKMDGTKLALYTGTADAVSVPAGTTVVGADAFSDNTSITSVTFPKTLTTIEASAFSGCTSLKSITIPEGVEYIGNGAFADCKSLTSVSLPSTILSLGSGVFAGCNQLSNISESSTRLIMDDGVLYNGDGTLIYQVLAGRAKNSYTMPNSVKQIGKYAFWGCENLTNVGVSPNVYEIGDYAFSNASGLTSISLPYSVRRIGIKAFEDCTALTDCEIPVSVTKIAPTAFDGCYSLNIIAESGTTAAQFDEQLKQKQLLQAEYEDSVSQNAFRNKENPHKSTEQTESEKKNSTADPWYASNVDNYVEWDVDSPGVLGRSKVVSRQAVVLMDAESAAIYSGEGQVGGAQKTVDTTDYSSAIKNDRLMSKAFYMDNSLSNVTLPGGISEIGNLSFARSSVTGVTIPAGVEKIEEGAFYHCDNLSNVTIPNTVTEIEANAFTYTPYLSNWLNGPDMDDFLIVGDGVLLAYKGTGNQVNIPQTVKTISPYVFKDHTEITYVSLPDSVKNIGEGAFDGCLNLSIVSGGNKLETVADRAFYNCPIKTVRIPQTVTSLGLKAYGGNSGVNSVVFQGDKLPKVTYTDTSSRLSNDAYRGCVFDGIDTAIVPNGFNLAGAAGTVLDNEVLGFDGNVYCLATDGSKNATFIGSTDTQEDCVIPESIAVYDSTYKVGKANHLSYSKAAETVSDNSLSGLLVVDHSDLKKLDCDVTSSGSTVDMTGYHTYISDANASDVSKLTDAITTYYGEVNGANTLFMDISLYDESDSVKIHQVGKNNVAVTVEVPSKMLSYDLCLMSLDDNDNPEITFCEYQKKDGKEYVTFRPSHFSVFALYGATGDLAQKVATKMSASSGTMGLDDTPNTGDTLEIKVILAIGIFCLGGFVMLAGFMPRTFRKKKVNK
ncbi:MAG: leucine-rich repeat domain-containing protein [Lachnospiraceae bacterium]|nr:leucine-rich repeat domain-containing protein [Lachnospiraceae bacterium]